MLWLKKFNINSGENITKKLNISSTEKDLSIYGEEIEIDFSVQGKTGKRIFTAYSLISEDAVDYDFTVISPPNKEINFDP